MTSASSRHLMWSLILLFLVCFILFTFVESRGSSSRGSSSRGSSSRGSSSRGTSSRSKSSSPSSSRGISSGSSRPGSSMTGSKPSGSVSSKSGSLTGKGSSFGTGSKPSSGSHLGSSWGSGSKSKSGSNVGSNWGTGSKLNTGSISNSNTWSNSDSRPGLNSGKNTWTNSGPRPGSNVGTGSFPSLDTHPGLNPGKNTWSNSDIRPGSNSGTGSWPISGSRPDLSPGKTTWSNWGTDSRPNSGNPKTDFFRTPSGIIHRSDTYPFFQKLPSIPTRVRLPSLTHSLNPLTSNQRAIQWGVGLWSLKHSTKYSLTSLDRYLRYRCRSRVANCRDTVTQSHHDGYCQFFVHEKQCLRSGCSAYETVWLEKASCSTNDIPTNNDREPTGWLENEPLRLSLEIVDTSCSNIVQECRRKHFPAGQGGSYCALFTDHQNCLVNERGCKQEQWQMLNEAACGRTVVDFEEAWPTSAEFRLATAVTREACQLNVEECKVQHMTDSQNYCNMLNYVNRQTCGNVTESCTNMEWEGLRLEACYVSNDMRDQDRPNGAGSLGDDGVGVRAVVMVLLVYVASLSMMK